MLPAQTPDPGAFKGKMQCYLVKTRGLTAFGGEIIRRLQTAGKHSQRGGGQNVDILDLTTA